MDSITVLSNYEVRIQRAPHLGERSRQQYTRAIRRYLSTGGDLFDRHSLIEYSNGLKSSNKGFFKAALRILTRDFDEDLKNNATPENLAQVQAALLRMESIRNSVTVEKQTGTKHHTWLTQAQVKRIMSLCTDRQDWLIMGLLLGAGLRREELAALCYEDVKTQPKANGEQRAMLEVKGKGDKSRLVPLSPALARRLIGSGKVISVSAQRIYEIVGKFGKKIGVPTLQPHDCRRTFAQLGYEAGVPITQISILLGHSSIKVTQTYLNLTLDLEVTASDMIQLE